MTLILATWAHGNAVVAQHPAGGALQDVDGRNFTSVVGYREGSMAVYEGTGSGGPERFDTWFHIPIPTVSWLPRAEGGPSGRAFLDNFSVLFKAENCSVSDVHAWDGGKSRFFAAGVPNLGAGGRMTGDCSEFGKFIDGFQGNTRIRMTNIFTPRERDSEGRSARHAMLFGLGISVRVDFTTGSPDPKKIVFLGAGASWHDVAVGE